jgi:hypothetical protein
MIAHRGFRPTTAYAVKATAKDLDCPLARSSASQTKPSCLEIIGKRIAPCVLQYSSNEFGLRSYGERSPVVVVRYENALRFKNSYEFRDGYLGLGNMLQDAVNSAATF